MGRSTRKQADENRQRIVEVASGLFRAHGVAAVAIADVMKAAGLTQGGFYRHFPNKDGLAAEACALAFGKAVENFRRVAREAALDSQDVTEALIAYYLSPKPPERTCPMIALALDAGRASADNPLRQAYDEGVQALYKTFVELVPAAGGTPDDIQTRALFSSMVGANLLGGTATTGSAFRKSVLADRHP